MLRKIETLNKAEIRWIRHRPHYESDELNPELSVSPWSGHRDFAYDLMVFLRPGKIIELGTHYGCSFFSFLQASKDFCMHTEHVAVDTWIGEEHSGLYGEDVYQLVQLTVKTFFSDKKVHLIRKKFDEALNGIEDGTIDILHIDGFHSYDAVNHDYQTWLPKLKNNGVILFHDVAPSCGYGSADFWFKIKQGMPYFEFLEHSFGLGVLFPKGNDVFKSLERWLTDDLLTLYRFQFEISLLSRKYRDSKRQLEERWDVLQSMDRMIKDRDEAIVSQAKVLEERWDVLQSMDRMIKDRDEAVVSQAKVLEERFDVMQSMDREIKELGKTIIAQTNLNYAQADLLRMVARDTTPESMIKRLSHRDEGTVIFYDLAFSFYLFTVRLYNAVISKGVEDLFFFAREGQLLKEMFDFYQFLMGGASQIRTHYLKVSRRSTFLLSLGPVNEENFEILFRQYRRISILDFLKSIDLDEFASQLTSNLGFDPSDLGVAIADLPSDTRFRNLLEHPEFRELYEAQRSARAHAFERYLKSFIGGNELPDVLHVVDVGWKGTIQDNIFNWYHRLSRGIAQIEGYYLGLVDIGAMSKFNRKIGLLFSNVKMCTRGFHVFNENRSLFEIFLHADHGSAHRYVLDENGTPNVLEDEFVEREMILEKVRPLSQSILLTFRQIAVAATVKPINESHFLELTLKKHSRMVFNPSHAEIEWIFSVSHMENFGLFKQSFFGQPNKRHTILERVKFTWEVLRHRRPTELGFWPWLSMHTRGFPGLEMVYGLYRRLQCKYFGNSR